LRNCLAAIVALKPAADEVLVVDNTSGDSETERLAREFSVRYTVEPRPGLSCARNRGLAESKSKIVAFLDDDSAPDVNWLEFLIDPFKDGDVAVVTGGIVSPDTSGGEDITGSSRSLCSEDPLWFEIASLGGLGIGANMALRKTACARWKGFDERLGRGAPLWLAEENHAFVSLLSLGYRAVHVPGAVVTHQMKPMNIEREAASAFAYWLLLFFEFPGHRIDMLSFLIRRLMRRNLIWPRVSQGPGAIIRSGWRVHLKAAMAGSLLYFRSRNLKRR
jgi:glycosyltransferase involved in cell wall biosynthesis